MTKPTGPLEHTSAYINRTNEWVLEKARQRKGDCLPQLSEKLSYFGHIPRKMCNCLKREIIQGHTDLSVQVLS